MTMEECNICNGNGYTIEIEAECCGNLQEGYCCGVPDAIQVQRRCLCNQI